jgi:processive 1,2-diacylglycerol beta-glucosyltransferase
MKTLILSCSTGEGHNSAAKAIYEEMKRRKLSCEFIDALSFASLKTAKIVADSFNSIAKNAPKMFGLMYKAGDLVSNTFIKSPVYLANTLYAKKLYHYILKNKIDVVISSHLFPMEALTYLKLKYDLKTKCYGILTDYTCIPFLEETKLDGYFIAHKEIGKELVKKKINKKYIITSGIPVSNKFIAKIAKEEARRKLKLPLDDKIILMMTGGVGCGSATDILNALLANLENNGKIIILVGRNNELKTKINNLFYKNKRLKVISFTKKVNLYMDACDLLLTKPGGLSSTEAAVKNVPFIHTMPIPGCETKNALFFAKHHMSIKVGNLKELIVETKKLLNNSKLCTKMISNQNKYINKQAAKDICDYIIKNHI